MDARVVAELQHIELAALDTAPNAVQPGNVWAGTLHVEQGFDHLLIATVEEVHRGSCPHQKQDSPKDPEPLRHPPVRGANASLQKQRSAVQPLF